MKLWFASRNRNKIDEVSQILGQKVKLKTLFDIPDFPAIDETGVTFLENSRIKARALWSHFKEPVFSDDSGLIVDALGGKPGVYSMRFSEPNPTHEKNIEKLLRELGKTPISRRTARFQCVVVYLDSAGNENNFLGEVKGFIGFEPRGMGGFGYDPVFILPEMGRTIAELSQEEKNRISHRGNAVKALKTHLKIL